MKKFIAVLLFVVVSGSCKQSAESSASTDSTTTTQEVTTTTPTTFNLKTYQAKLSSLPKTVASSGEALEIFRTSFDKQNPASCDSAFDHFVNFQMELIGTLQEQFEARPDYETVASGGEQSQRSKETQAYLQSLTDNAMVVAEEEGMTFIDGDAAAIKERFHQFLSPAGKAYIGQWKVEMEQPYAIDAGITIPIIALIDRLVYWDNFLVQYPGTIFQDKVQSKYNAYLYFLLIGMDNTPAFDYNEDGAPEKINDEFFNAYQQFASKYPPSKSQEVIKRYLQVLLASDHRKTAEVDKFIEGYSNF